MYKADQLLRVKSTHRFHADKLGRFKFMGGEFRDVVVLTTVENDHTYFCVGLDDVETPSETFLNSEFYDKP